MRRYACLVALVATLLSCASLWAPAEAARAVTVSARLAGEAIPATPRRPSRIDPTRRVLLELSVTNAGDRDVNVSAIVLRGRVVGLTFFDYETSVSIGVPARSTANRQFSLDLASLKGQATGLFNTDLILLDQGRHAVASKRTVVEVRGSWSSVYSLFGIALAAVTVATFVSAILDLTRQRLSPNRWRRAIRFLVPGFGLGLTAVFMLSAMRIFLAGSVSWVPIVAIPSVVGFALGYFTPTPDDSDQPDAFPAPTAGSAVTRS